MKPHSIGSPGQPVTFSFGGGADGTALLFEMRNRDMRPDLIQFADTGNWDAEKPETYTHVERMNDWTKKTWGLEIIIVRNDGMYGTLERNCLEKKMLPSVAYGFKSCSDKYKRRPQEKYCKTWPPAVEYWAKGCLKCGLAKNASIHQIGIDDDHHAYEPPKVLKIIGFNADEWHRVKNIEHPLYEVRYLLVEFGIGRRRVEEICFENLGYVPIKSACRFCPSSKKSEVIWLAKHHPDLFQRCIEMEQNVDYNSKAVQVECSECDGEGCQFCEQRGWHMIPGNTVVGLGRHWTWEEIVRADADQFKLFPEAPDVACMCFDGGTLDDD